MAAYSSSIPNRMDRKLADNFRLFEQIFVENDSADEEEDNRVRLEENAKSKEKKMRIFHPEAFAPLNKETTSNLEKSMKQSASKAGDANSQGNSRPATSKSAHEDRRPATAMSSMSGTTALTEGGRQKALTVHAAEEVRILVWTTEHVMLMYIISLFSSCDESSGASIWIRGSCLHVILFELIRQQIIDMDFSPQRFKMSDGLQQHPTVWNISQEAEEMLRDLFFHKYIQVLRAMSQDLTISIFFQITNLGIDLLKHVPSGLLSDVHRVLYETLPDGSLSNILHVKLSPREQLIVSLDPSKSLPTILDVKVSSQIMEIEDVPYKSKPVFFKQSNRSRKFIAFDRNMDDFDDTNNLMDDDLHENLKLKDIVIQVVDWVPTGANQHRQLAAEIGAGERCRESYANKPKPGEPHVQLDILEYASDAYVHIVADLRDEDDSGIMQIETFGVRIQADGMVTSGLELYDAGGSQGKDISLDLLARIYADMEEDSTTVVQTIIGRSQKLMVESLWGESWNHRPTYRIVMCAALEPKLAAKHIINDSSITSEVAQVLGKIFGAFDYPKGIIVIGNSGVLVSGIKHSKGASPEVLAYVRYGALIIASKQLFGQLEAAEVSILNALEQTNSRLPYYVSGAHNQHRLLSSRNYQLQNLSVIGLLLQDSINSITEDTMREVSIDPSSPFDIELSIRILKPCVEDCLNRLSISQTLSRFAHQTSFAANQLRFIESVKTVSKSLRSLGQLFGVDRKKVAITTSVKGIVWYRLALHVADRINVRKNSHHFQTLVDGMHSAVSFLAKLKGYEATVWTLMVVLLALLWWVYGGNPVKTEKFAWRFSEAFLNLDKMERFLKSKRVKKIYSEQSYEGTLTKILYEETNRIRWKSSKVIVLLCINSNAVGFLHSANIALTRNIETLQLSADSVKRMLFHDLESAGFKNHYTMRDIQRLEKQRQKAASSEAAAASEALRKAEESDIEQKIAAYKAMMEPVDDSDKI